MERRGSPDERPERFLEPRGDTWLRSTLDCLLEGCQIIGYDWRYLYLNDAAAAQGRRSKEELLGRTMMDVYPGIDATPMFTRLRECMETRRRTRIENEFTFADGTSGWFELSIEPVPEGIVILSVDRTDSYRAQQEAEVLRRRFEQAQRLEALGRLAAGVAHDFNNLLGVITGSSELMRRRLSPEHPEWPRLERILDAAERAAGLTRQLLAFGRKQPVAPVVVDVNALLTDLDAMLQRLIGADVDLLLRAGTAVGAVRMDPTQLEQVVVNLVVNARDAMPAGGQLTIETAVAHLDEAYAAVHPGSRPGPHVLLVVSDTGCGMDGQTQQRVFEPFFTTKPEGKGSGLGLATVYGAVKQAGGHIWLYSEPGRGTTFKIYLPRCEDDATPVAGATTAAATGGHETVLVVEDAAGLRDVVCETLAEHGYTVLVARDGEEALHVVGGHAAPIHLVLSDLVMPRMGGVELAARLAVLRPDTRVLLMSGYSDAAAARHGALPPGATLLEKPFGGAQLARAVRQALDAPSPA